MLRKNNKSIYNILSYFFVTILFLLGLYFFYQINLFHLGYYNIAMLVLNIETLVFSFLMTIPLIYKMFYRNKFVSCALKLILWIFLIILISFTNFNNGNLGQSLSLPLLILLLVYVYRFEIKSVFKISFKKQSKEFKQLVTEFSVFFKHNVKKLSFILILFSFLLINFSLNANYEALLFLIWAVILITYLFSNNIIANKYLKNMIFLLTLVLMVYWINYSNGFISSILSTHPSAANSELGSNWTSLIEKSLLWIDLRLISYIIISYLLIGFKTLGQSTGGKKGF